MIQNPSVLHMTPAQNLQLMAFLDTYLSYLWQCTLPTSERGTTVRVIQAIQPRLIQEQEPHKAEVCLALTYEERRTVKQVLQALLKVYGEKPALEQRAHIIRELNSLLLLITQTMRQTQAF